MTALERDAAMGDQIVQMQGSAMRVLVIVGQAHQPGIARFLEGAGFTVAQESLPIACEQAPLDDGAEGGKL